LREIHHRVKNNLQVISSLLQLQSRGLDESDTQARYALRESQSRVQAMGLIHQKLYQTDTTSVSMADYVTQLGDTLLDTYRLNDRVEMYYDVEPIELDVDTAIPLGLIINELVTNSLKYAFPDGREGTIEISLYRHEGGFKLRVADDGVGTAAAAPLEGSTSFGTRLIDLLTQKLRGQVNTPASETGYATEIMIDDPAVAA
jgi:two-component sensor histidine kinase